jgi:hypothetical protein
MIRYPNPPTTRYKKIELWTVRFAIDNQLYQWNKIHKIVTMVDQYKY